ncbi:hypothetical protein P4V58_31310, partial [Bacillus wiedmannii]|uniref:hypothetical protein n=1 Tax=Bacillus wiedmannii TaxID=1890302 RepID=UPI002E1F43A1|nr:hypothetical protein [Bacillus wiedmannii]
SLLKYFNVLDKTVTSFSLQIGKSITYHPSFKVSSMPLNKKQIPRVPNNVTITFSIKTTLYLYLLKG